MSRMMCYHTYDMVCVDEWADKDTLADDCKNCPYYNNGKLIYEKKRVVEDE